MEQKNFFDALDAKSALVVGLVGGVLVLGTIGFIVLGIFVLKGDLTLSMTKSDNVVQVVNANVPSTQNNPAAVAPANIVKANKPKVELFVMSYCPYGLQMEKAYIPAWELLKNKADIDVKFVNYAMHGQKEVDENTRQYCIQKDQSNKFIGYLKCFTASGDYQSCLTQSGVSVSSLDSCITKTDSKFGITAKFNDQASWLSGQYPLYPIHSDLNQKYGVQGSPTLVINGAEAQAGRTAEAIKQAICAGFNNPPSECNQVLSNNSYDPGFGTAISAAQGGNTPGCGV